MSDTTDYQRYADSEDRQVELRRIAEDAQVKRYKIQMDAEVKQAEVAQEAARSRRAHRRLVWGWGGSGLAVVVVALAIVGGIVYGSTRPEPVDQRPAIEQEREVQCLTEGGGWVPGDLVEGGSGLCVYPGKVTQ